MKFFAAFVLAAAVMSAGHCVPLNNASPTPQQIVELTDAIIAYMQTNMPKDNPKPLPDFKNERLNYPEIDTDVTASGNNGMAYGEWQMTVDQYEFDPSTLSTRVRLTYPNVTQVYDYEAEGKIFGHKVSGKGVMKTETLGFGFAFSNLRFEEINNSLQMTSLDIKMVIDDVKIELGGMKVDTIPVQQLEKLMEDYSVAQTRKQNEKQAAATMKAKFNQLTSGHSTDEVIQWLKDHSPITLSSEMNHTNGEVQANFIIQDYVFSSLH